MNKRKFEGLIFDLDGVIVNTEHNHYLAWKKTAEILGVSFSEKENEKLKGLSRADSLKAILNLENVTISHEEFETLMLDKNEFYLDSIQRLEENDILPGVKYLLQNAKDKGVKMAVGSSSKNAPFIIDRLGLTDYFEIIVDGSMVSIPKPNPEVFLNGAKAMGLKPQNCIVFEDAESGVKAGLDGGFYTIGVGNENIKNLANEYKNDLTEFNLDLYA
jgi:beta-phosphoglucomutase